MSSQEIEPLEFNEVAPARPNLLEDMRVSYVFCGSIAVYGGVADSFNQLSSYMRQVEGMQTSAIVGSSPDAEMERQVLSNFKPESVHRLSSWNISGSFNGSENPLGTFVPPLKINRLVKDINPQIMSVMLPMMPHVGGRVVRNAQDHDIPVIGTYHIDSNEKLTNLAVNLSGRIDKSSLDKFETMVAVSPVAAEHLRRVYGYDHEINIIPNAVDIDFYESAEPDEAFMDKFGRLFEDDSKKTILFVGRPDERKGLGELIDSVKLLHETKPELDFQLVVCGDGPDLTKYKDKAEMAGLSNMTHFTGKVDESELAMMQSQSDAMALLATGGESQGIVVLKAIAGKLPTVFGNNAGYASIAGHLDSSKPGGAMVNPKNHPEVAEALNNVLEFDMIARRIQKDQHSVLGKYALATVGAQHAELYRRTIGISVPYRNDVSLI